MPAVGFAHNSHDSRHNLLKSNPAAISTPPDSLYSKSWNIPNLE